MLPQTLQLNFGITLLQHHPYSLWAMALTVNPTSGTTMVAYCWAAVPGYSAFGSYTGNGSADGPFVYLGFRPRYVLIKAQDSTDDWYICMTLQAKYL